MPLDAGFKAMLTMTGTWEHKVPGHDKWGNESFEEPELIDCFITEQTQDWGSEDGEGKQHRQTITRMSLITDAIGATMGDRITLYGTTMYVVGVDTPKDEVGIDLMHTLSLVSEPEG